MILGIDIGGTKIKYGYFTDDNMLVKSGEINSGAKEGAEKLLQNIFNLLDGFSFSVLGVSTAGVVNEDGSILYANENIPNYTGVKLKEILEQKYGAKTAVINDIDAGALGQYLQTKEDDFYFIALGTGVGGAFVKDGKIIKGAGAFGGQIGYLPSVNGGLVDETVSTRGLEKLSSKSGKEVFSLAKQGDKKAKKDLEIWLDGLVALIKTVVGFFSPKKVVLGGGISAQGDYLVGLINEKIKDFPVPYKDAFSVEVAKVGNLSAVLGSIYIARSV